MNNRKAKQIRKQCAAMHGAIKVAEPSLWQISVVKINNLIRALFFLKPHSLAYSSKRSFKSFYRSAKRSNQCKES